jgi:FkbM family methyltransferase
VSVLRYWGLAIRSRALSKALRWTFTLVPRRDLVELGDFRASWIVPETLLPFGGVCYCGGVGENISFDLELVGKYGCDVYAFDPTPRAIKFVESAPRPVAFHFIPYGIWSAETSLRFYVPRNPLHVSHSAVNLQKTAEFFTAKCKPISSIMKELNHERLDLLKLDIEGAEYAALEDILSNGIHPRIVCVEFDQPTWIFRTIRMVKRMMSDGYSLVSIEGWNYTFSAE